MGDPPEWYSLMKAAEYYRVPPWVLLELPGAPAWISVATQLMNAEAHAMKMKSRGRRQQR